MRGSTAALLAAGSRKGCVMNKRTTTPHIDLTVTVPVRTLHAILRDAARLRQPVHVALGKHLLRRRRSGRPITLNLSPV